MSHADANQSVMMQVPEAGPFCRALFPVHLDGGYTVHFGVWVAIHPDDLQRAFGVWWTDNYQSLELEGYLGNDLPRFGGLGVSVRLEVLNPDHTPTVTHSESPEIASALSDTWRHDDLLPLLPS